MVDLGAHCVTVDDESENDLTNMSLLLWHKAGLSCLGYGARKFLMVGTAEDVVWCPYPYPYDASRTHIIGAM